MYYGYYLAFVVVWNDIFLYGGTRLAGDTLMISEFVPVFSGWTRCFERPRSSPAVSLTGCGHSMDGPSLFCGRC